MMPRRRRRQQAMARVTAVPTPVTPRRPCGCVSAAAFRWRRCCCRRRSSRGWRRRRPMPPPAQAQEQAKAPPPVGTPRTVWSMPARTGAATRRPPPTRSALRSQSPPPHHCYCHPHRPAAAAAAASSSPSSQPVCLYGGVVDRSIESRVRITPVWGLRAASAGPLPTSDRCLLSVPDNRRPRQPARSPESINQLPSRVPPQSNHTRNVLLHRVIRRWWMGFFRSQGKALLCATPASPKLLTEARSCFCLPRPFQVYLDRHTTRSINATNPPPTHRDKATHGVVRRPQPPATAVRNRGPPRLLPPAADGVSCSARLDGSHYKHTQ